MSKNHLLSFSVAQLTVSDSSTLKIGSTNSVTLKRTPPVSTIVSGNSILTVAQATSGLLLQTPAANSTITLPTAAALVAFFNNEEVGDSFDIRVLNLAPATYTTTVAVGSGGSAVGTLVIQPASSVRFLLRFTNVTVGSEAYTLYAF